MIVVLKAISDWFRRNWTWLRWVLFPLGILVAVLGWTRKTNVTVVSPALEDADKKKAELDQQAKDAEVQAAKERDAQIGKADAQADSGMAVVLDAEKKDASKLQADEDALNKELLDIGKDQRS
jgi:cell division protein FtsB